MIINPLAGLIATLAGWWTWLKWFFEKLYSKYGKDVAQFWGVVVIVAGWIWVCLEYIDGNGLALIAKIKDGLPIVWPQWANTVGPILAKANLWYPLAEHFDRILKLMTLMSFLGAVKIARKLLF